MSASLMGVPAFQNYLLDFAAFVPRHIFKKSEHQVQDVSIYVCLLGRLNGDMNPLTLFKIKWPSKRSVPCS
jgi:hypothetical protein